jgi:hypothetical protein
MTNIQRLLKIPTVLLGTALLATSCAGTVGSAGATGPQGPVGPQGPQGLTGAIGSTGPQGPVGPAGPQGLSGAQGPRGFSGSDGSQGVNGKSAYELYLEQYPGYDDLTNKNQTTWINDLAAANLVKNLTATVKHYVDPNTPDFNDLLTRLSYSLTEKIYLGQILNNANLTSTANYPAGIEVEGWYTDATYTTLVQSSTFIVDGNETAFPKLVANATLTGLLAKPVSSGGFSNTVDFNANITNMWNVVFDSESRQFDVSNLTQNYVDYIKASVPGASSSTLSNVPIPIKLIVPSGKTFTSAKVAFTTEDYLLAGQTFSSTSAIVADANFGGDLILWANANAAYGWERPENKVTYAYEVLWSDNTKTYYYITFVDADKSLAIAVSSGGFSNTTDFNANITAMWDLVFDEQTNTLDVSEITQAYVDYIKASVPGASSSTRTSVPIPVKLVPPSGATGVTAQQVKFTNADYTFDGNAYGNTTAVVKDANFGGDYILWLNANQATGWTRFNDKVVYAYKVTFSTSGAAVEKTYYVTFKDVD